jgi:hypothetical protein
MDERYITKTTLLNRPGWTAGLVARLLAEPDKRKKVSGVRHPLALYALSRVEQAETTADFGVAPKDVAKRKAAAAKAVETKIAKLMAQIEAMPVTVQRYKLAQVRRMAIESYNERNFYTCATKNDDPLFLDRITVNFIRHELTEYDTALWEVAGKTGVVLAVAEIRRRVYSVIAQAYPELKDECERQIKARQCVAEDRFCASA